MKKNINTNNTNNNNHYYSYNNINKKNGVSSTRRESGGRNNQQWHSSTETTTTTTTTTTTREEEKMVLMMDLFSKNRLSEDVKVGGGRLAVSAKLGGEDLLLTPSSDDTPKHDYDWLLTPPGTPLFASSNANETPQPAKVAPRSSSLARSASATKASRLSVSQPDGNHSSRPARSNSATRPSVSSQFSTYSSNRSSNILNTSSASVSSYARPSSPITRSPSTARPSTPSARSTPSRPSTPSRIRPPSTNSSVEKPRPAQNSRPSTPSPRVQVPSNLTPAIARPSSRPSTPTRRSPVPSVSPVSGSSASAGRITPQGRVSAPSSRPSSPSPRVRPAQQLVVPPDFPLDTPPNLRTTLPDRPLSAGRSRPGVAANSKGNTETIFTGNGPRRHSSPIITRGRLTEPPGKGRPHSNGHAADMPEPRKASHVSDFGLRKPVRSTSTAVESAGFGRNISKKSMDMAIRHMDIRMGSGGARPLSSTTLFPQSIRSAGTKAQSIHSASAPESINNNGISENGGTFENKNRVNRQADSVSDASEGHYSGKLSEADMYESSRYDAILLKEDLKNMNWLHSIDDKSDQGSMFDSGFEPLPEPFGPL